MNAKPVCVGRLHRIGSPAGWVDEYPHEDRAFRRLACMMLLSGYLGAQEGDAGDRRWVESPSARLLADLVDLPYWPPRPDQFYPLDELERRAAALSSGVHVSRTIYGSRLTAKERRLRRRAAHDSLFARDASTTATGPVDAALAIWGQFFGIGNYTVTDAS